nr:MAG TPA: DNA polymerase B [Bacteriophage sp.]
MKYNNDKVVQQILKRKEKREYIAKKSIPENSVAKKNAKKKKDKKTEIVITADCETYTKSSVYTYIWSLAWYDGRQVYVSADEKDEHASIAFGGYYMKHFDNFLLYLLDHYDGEKVRIKCYFHNLKFDFEFFRRYLLENVQLQDVTGIKPKDFKNVDNAIMYLINDMGGIYSVTIKIHGLQIKFVDSFKILPFNLAKLTQEFKVSDEKVDYNIANDCFLTDTNANYIENDVKGLYEVIKIFREITNSTKDTIASCAYENFWEHFVKIPKGLKYKEAKAYSDAVKDKYFPTLTLEEDNFFRKAYKGAFCYVNEKIKGKVIKGQGDVYDVNSLYPYIMDSTLLLPIGRPSKTVLPAWKNHLTFYKLNVKATIKPNVVPAIFAKGFLAVKTKALYMHNIDTFKDGKPFVFTECDLRLLQKCYDVEEMEILEQYYFEAVEAKSLFGEYIKYFKQMKIAHSKEKDAYYFIAKLFQNSLYGKFGASYYFSTLKYNVEDDSVKVYIEDVTDRENNEPTEQTYVPLAAYITAHAREYIINLILKNPEAFLYCDTDSIHMMHVEHNHLPIHNSEYGYLKNEFVFNRAIYVRQKTYIELGRNVKKRALKYSIGFCGLTGKAQKELAKMIFKCKVKLSDITNNFEIKGKSQLKRVRGGYNILNTTYKIKS